MPRPPSAITHLPHRRALSSGEAARGLDLDPTMLVRVVAQIPVARGSSTLAMLEEPDGERAAGYRLLRHNLPKRDDGRARVTLVSSARAGEGMTRCALNLALALSDYHPGRVLLVDGNFANPSLAAALELQDVPCFAMQLARQAAGGAKAPWQVLEILPSGLHLLPVDVFGGKRPDFHAGAFSAAIRSLSESGYEQIVVATPPVLESAQPTLMQEAADGVLLTCRRSQSRGKQIRRSVELFGRDIVLGVVLDLR